jgi:transcriptional regulator with XRE-family HTH domain
LGNEVRKRRGNKTLREAAREIGSSPATLMRVESGRVPDVETFGKLCVWLGVDPGSYLGIKPTSAGRPRGAAQPATVSDAAAASGAAVPGAQPTHLVVSAHFKADKTPQPETVKALAAMILFAAASRRQKTTITDGDT